jgi:hypothetical protein
LFAINFSTSPDAQSQTHYVGFVVTRLICNYEPLIAGKTVEDILDIRVTLKKKE